MRADYQPSCQYSKCYICKKQISWQTYKRDDYAYKKSIKSRTRYACSWSCFNKMIAKYDKPKKKSNFDKVMDLMSEGLSDEEIAKKTGLALLTVKIYISKSDCFA